MHSHLRLYFGSLKKPWQWSPYANLTLNQLFAASIAPHTHWFHFKFISVAAPRCSVGWGHGQQHIPNSCAVFYKWEHSPASQEGLMGNWRWEVRLTCSIYGWWKFPKGQVHVMFVAFGLNLFCVGVSFLVKCYFKHLAGWSPVETPTLNSLMPISLSRPLKIHCVGA